MSVMGREGQVTPCLRYKDAKAAISWLSRVVGFTEQLVVPGEGDQIVHAQLVLGNGMIMLSSDREDQYGFRAPGPDGSGAALNCFIITALDALYARVTAAGEKVLEGGIIDTPYGSRAFTIRDPEGHLWHFGTYDPWA
ncbi:VOC family protein [Niveispirillum sp. KHB5.9]|uniref:VOC family protein n=1 Tax=Niveispirillum sp. KHB5.9 TaxID=3400269 RepID=UPI003A8C5EE3